MPSQKYILKQSRRRFSFTPTPPLSVGILYAWMFRKDIRTGTRNMSVMYNQSNLWSLTGINGQIVLRSRIKSTGKLTRKVVLYTLLSNSPTSCKCNAYLVYLEVVILLLLFSYFLLSFSFCFLFLLSYLKTVFHIAQKLQMNNLKDMNMGSLDSHKDHSVVKLVSHKTRTLSNKNHLQAYSEKSRDRYF